MNERRTSRRLSDSRSRTATLVSGVITVERPMLAIAKVDKSAMLRVRAEHKVVSDANLAAEQLTGARERKDRVVFAAAAVDCDGARRRDRKALRRARSNILRRTRDASSDFSFAQFPPGNVTVAVGVEGVGQIKITNREFEPDPRRDRHARLPAGTHSFGYAPRRKWRKKAFLRRLWLPRGKSAMKRFMVASRRSCLAAA